ncbi:MAG TPA: preprotein translocase subunit YajC [Opitutales bacterium]|nr:preprotein translocase subunit YajC [Opitutales bacterium]
MQIISTISNFPLILGQGDPQENPLQLIIMFAALFGAMWFFLIAPQRKKQKEHQEMISKLKTGDSVLTNGGIYGIISNVKDDRFVVKVSDNTKLEINKSFIQTVLKSDS